MRSSLQFEYQRHVEDTVIVCGGEEYLDVQSEIRGSIVAVDETSPDRATDCTSFVALMSG